MTDPRPRPQYGEYADIPPAPPAATPEPVVETAVAAPRRRTWDVVLTTALLLWGVVDVVTGFRAYADLGTGLRAAYEMQGIPAFQSEAFADDLGAVLNVVRVVLLIAALVVSLLLLSRHRLAFWAPLGAGVLAALTLMVFVVVIIAGDPGFAQYVAEQTAP
jgi:hypothetical protein